MTSGYSGTPLPSKLGIKPSSNLLLLGAPAGYRSVLRPLPSTVRLKKRADKTVDIVQVFATKREELAKQLAVLRKRLNPDAAIWVSWPKKASKVPTSITEDTIRELLNPKLSVAAVTLLASIVAAQAADRLARGGRSF